MACTLCKGDDPNCVCEGSRRVSLRETVRVQIPPGARHGAKLRLAAKGTAGLEGAADGDLFLLLEPEPLEGYRREGADLHKELKICAEKLRAGGTLRVQGPWGPVQIRFSAKTRHLKLPRAGLPRWGGGERGDLHLHLQVLPEAP